MDETGSEKEKTRNEISSNLSGNREEKSDKLETVMSKRQVRKLKWREKYLELRKEKRVEERKRKKARILEKKIRGEDTGPSRKQLREARMSESKCKIRVVVDMSFDSYMDDRDIKRTYMQLQHSYAANRRAANPMQLHLVSFSGPSRKVYDSVSGTDKWDIYIHEDPCEKIFPSESLVYLTSDSPEIIEELDKSKTYVIGGLIDHNHQKGLCYSLAKDKGWATARLPIDKYFKLTSRKVLTINQVFEILLRFTELGDWHTAFQSVIPKRKGAKDKEETNY